MRDIFAFFQQHWPWIAGIGGATTAVAVFIRECLTIAKLRKEIIALRRKAQEDEKKRDSLIKIPSDQEIELYSLQRSARRYSRELVSRRWVAGTLFDSGMHQAHRSILVPIIIALCFGVLGYFIWPFLWRLAAGILISLITYVSFAIAFVCLSGREATLKALEQELRRLR